MIKKIRTFILCVIRLALSSTSSQLFYAHSKADTLSSELLGFNWSILCFKLCWCCCLLCVKRISGWVLDVLLV